MVFVKSKKSLKGGFPAHLKNLKKKKSLKQEKENKKFKEMNNDEIIKKYKIKVYNKEKLLIFESFFYDPLFRLVKNKIINIAKEKELKYVGRDEWEDGWEYYDVKTKKKIKDIKIIEKLNNIIKDPKIKPTKLHSTH